MAAATAATHQPPDPLVASRQASMKAMAEAARTIAWMFEGKRDFSRRDFAEAAELIRRSSGEALVETFPAAALGPPSQARSEIAAAAEEFAALADHLQRTAAALSQAAERSPDHITSSMRMASGAASGGTLLGARSKGQDPADLATVPAEHLLHMMLQDCTACHARFREKME